MTGPDDGSMERGTDTGMRVLLTVALLSIFVGGTAGHPDGRPRVVALHPCHLRGHDTRRRAAHGDDPLVVWWRSAHAAALQVRLGARAGLAAFFLQEFMLPEEERACGGRPRSRRWGGSGPASHHVAARRRAAGLRVVPRAVPGATADQSAAVAIIPHGQLAAYRASSRRRTRRPAGEAQVSIADSREMCHWQLFDVGPPWVHRGSTRSVCRSGSTALGLWCAGRNPLGYRSIPGCASVGRSPSHAGPRRLTCGASRPGPLCVESGRSRFVNQQLTVPPGSSVPAAVALVLTAVPTALAARPTRKYASIVTRSPRASNPASLSDGSGRPPAPAFAPARTGFTCSKLVALEPRPNRSSVFVSGAPAKTRESWRLERDSAEADVVPE